MKQKVFGDEAKAWWRDDETPGVDCLSADHGGSQAATLSKSGIAQRREHRCHAPDSTSSLRLHCLRLTAFGGGQR